MKINNNSIGYIVVIVLFVVINVLVVRAILTEEPVESAGIAVSSSTTPTMLQIGTLSQIGTPPQLGTPDFTETPAGPTSTPALPTFTLQPTATLPPTPVSLEISGYDCIPSDTKKELALVREVINGNTIVVTIDGESEIVRYIGVELSDENSSAYSQAFVANRRMVDNEYVVLIKDTLETDRDGRLLRFVFVGRSLFVNYELVLDGLAYAETNPPNDACAAYFADAQRIATEKEEGIWTQD